MDREELKDIARHTIKVIDKGYYTIGNTMFYIANAAEDSKTRTKLYTEDERISLRKEPEAENICHIEVTKETTLMAAKRLKDLDDNVAVLNFASAKKPGGGFLNGSVAQEETIARASTLYDTLTKYNDTFYKYNIGRNSPYYTDRIIYSPNVIVFKNDACVLLGEPYKINIITSPAVNAGEVYEKNNRNADADLNKIEEKIFNVMEERIRRIIKIAIINGNTSIVLGAFGCGVFRNKIEDIASMFKEVLIGEGYASFFTNITFAVYDKSGNEAVEKFKKYFY